MNKLPVTVLSGFLDYEQTSEIEADWQEPWGDRRQELVFIGIKMDEEGIRSQLDQALLSPQEMKRPASWRAFHDPYELSQGASGETTMSTSDSLVANQ
jgi:hypothetical protein